MQFIDLSRQQSFIREKIEMRIRNVLDSGKYIMGSEIVELENKLADYVGVTHCITCSSGTDALLMPLIAQEIGPSDAVITTPFTFIASAEVIRLVGATPVFVDICPDTFNINPALIPDAIQYAHRQGLNPKAIIPVDLFGLPAQYDEIEKTATENGLFVLEDAAQSFGGKIFRKKAGSFGNAASTSFFPAKPLGCYGDGGAIFTSDDQLAHLLRSIRVHGSGSDKYDNIRVGINGRLDTLQAAVLLEKLSIFPKEVERRNQAAEYYTNNLPIKYRAPIVPDNYLSSWAQYSIILEENQNRDRIITLLKERDIPAMIYYKISLHLQQVFNYLGYKKGDFPVSEQTSRNILSIPMHPYLEKSEQDQILETLNDAM